MKAAIGFSRHNVQVSCAHCNYTFDALDQDSHNLMRNYKEAGVEVVFELELDCPRCSETFILESIEY